MDNGFSESENGVGKRIFLSKIKRISTKSDDICMDNPKQMV